MLLGKAKAILPYFYLGAFLPKPTRDHLFTEDGIQFASSPLFGMNPTQGNQNLGPAGQASTCAKEEMSKGIFS